MAESISKLLGSSSSITPLGLQTHQNVRPSTAFCLIPMKDFIDDDENIGFDCHLSPTQVIMCWLSGDPGEIGLVPLHHHCVPLAALPLNPSPEYRRPRLPICPPVHPRRSLGVHQPWFFSSVHLVPSLVHCHLSLL